jgi:hypothetical protein
MYAIGRIEQPMGGLLYVVYFLAGEKEYTTKANNGKRLLF